jgi:hypothetical protein
VSIRHRILFALCSLLMVGSLVSWLAVRMIQDIESSISFLSSHSSAEASAAAKLVVTIAKLEHQLDWLVSVRNRFGEGDGSGEESLQQGSARVWLEYRSLQVYLTNCAEAARITGPQSQVDHGHNQTRVASAQARTVDALAGQLREFRPQLEMFFAKLKGSPSEARVYLEGDLSDALAQLTRSFYRYWTDAETDLSVEVIEARAQASQVVTKILFVWCGAACCIAGLTWWSVRSLVLRLSGKRLVRLARATWGSDCPPGTGMSWAHSPKPSIACARIFTVLPYRETMWKRFFRILPYP